MIALPPVVEIPNLFDQVTPTDVERYRAFMGRGDRTSTVGFWKYLLHKGKLCLDRGSTGFWIAVAFLKSGQIMNSLYLRNSGLGCVNHY